MPKRMKTYTVRSDISYQVDGCSLRGVAKIKCVKVGEKKEV